MFYNEGAISEINLIMLVKCPKCSYKQRVARYINSNDLEYKQRPFNFKCEACNHEDKFHFKLGLRINESNHKETKDEICPCCKQKAMYPTDELTEIINEINKSTQEFLQWRVKINEK